MKRVLFNLEQMPAPSFEDTELGVFLHVGSDGGDLPAQFVADALVTGIWRRGKPDSLLHHSDRGSQYTSEQFQKLMADHGVMSRLRARINRPRATKIKHRTTTVEHTPTRTFGDPLLKSDAKLE